MSEISDYWKPQLKKAEERLRSLGLRAGELEADNARLRAALESVPKIAHELHARWDEGQRAGKILIALMDPSLKYRADITAIHTALAARPAQEERE